MYRMLQHWWEALSRNSSPLQAVSSIFSAFVGLWTIGVLVKTYRAAQQAADAANAQARAAEAQVRSAEEAGRLAQLQLTAAQESAAAARDAASAERQHSELISKQLEIALTPYLVVRWFGNAEWGQPIALYNQSPSALALNISGLLTRTGQDTPVTCIADINPLGPSTHSNTNLLRGSNCDGSLRVRYDSVDGRHFIAGAEITPGGVIMNQFTREA